MEEILADIIIDKSMLLDILLAIVLGFAIGFEREITNKWAGLRTHIAAQILTGIGFIGGGTVLRHGYSIYGLTTAATLWITASIGMACGCGFTAMAIVCTVLAVGTLVLIRIFEKQYIHKGSKNPRKFKVSFYSSFETADNVYSLIIDKFKSIFEINKAASSSNEGLMKISFKLDIYDKNPVQALHKELNDIEGIESVSIQELYE